MEEQESKYLKYSPIMRQLTLAKIYGNSWCLCKRPFNHKETMGQKAVLKVSVKANKETHANMCLKALLHEK
jgi:hypothetical protein